MRKLFHILSVVIVVIALTSGFAHAGILGKVKMWLTGEVIALIASTVLVLVGGALGLVFRKIARTFKEAGEFLSTLGEAIEDHRITRDELACIVKEGRDVFNVWRCD